MARSNRNFKERVLVVVKNIPRGQTLSYGEVALRSGNAGAARAVGAIMRANQDPLVPCHRVIRTDGGLGGFNRGPKLKKQLLEFEAAETINVV